MFLLVGQNRVVCIFDPLDGSLDDLPET